MRCLNWIESSFSKYGGFDITLGEEEFPEEISYNKLIKGGSIFPGGGNTFYLPAFFKKLRSWGKYVESGEVE